MTTADDPNAVPEEVLEEQQEIEDAANTGPEPEEEEAEEEAEPRASAADEEDA